MLEIKVKYQFSEMKRLEFIEGASSNWIDLRAADDLLIKAGEFKLIPLGVAMQLPPGYEAHIVPRSSTFKNFKIIQTNGIGIIDNSYCGDDDWWFMPVYATQDTSVKFNDRICQFRLFPIQEVPQITEVYRLGNPNRMGHGSTGIQ